MGTLHNGGLESSLPIIVVGLPRSGTSLAEQILASHPDVFGAGELVFWGNAYNQHEVEILSGTMGPETRHDMANNCLQFLGNESENARRVVDKMPTNFPFLGLIHSVFPNARIIHMQRNPVDTCLSIYFQNFSRGYSFANDLEDLADYYRQYHRLMTHWRSVLPEDVFMEVPYEAVVNDQEGWSRRIIEFIGLEWDDACLDFHKTERRVGTASNWQVRQPIYKTSKERWRNYEKYVGPLLPLLELYDTVLRPSLPEARRGLTSRGRRGHFQKRRRKYCETERM